MPAEPADGDFTFVHAADLHLDAPLRGLTATAPEVAAALRDASLEAFGSLVELTMARGAAFLCLAGDIYDGAERGLRAQLAFRDGLERLSSAGISTFVVHGNHDPVEEGWSAVSAWPERTHFFSSEQVEAIEVRRGGAVLATVQGISFAKRETTENLALGFAPRAGGGLQVGLLHCNVAGTADGYASYSPCTLEELRSIGLDYWALGHIHETRILSGRPGGLEPWIVYPGSLQARSRKASEAGAKGAMVVSVRGGRIAAVEHVACDRVRFSLAEVDLSGLSSLSELHSALVEEGHRLAEAAGGRSLVLRARITGRGEVHAELVRAGVLEQLTSALREEPVAAGRFCWWDRIEDRSSPPLDLEALSAGDDFTADLLSVTAAAGQSIAASELFQKMPAELRKSAAGLVDELGLEAIFERSLLLALDRLELGS